MNLRRMAADGLQLLGRIETVDQEQLHLRADLSVNLARADAYFDDRFRRLFDAFIAKVGIAAPTDDQQPDVHQPPEVAELDLAKAGVATVIWTTGYGLDYRWIDLPIMDELGFPRQRRGVSEVPALYFIGLLWQTDGMSPSRWDCRCPSSSRNHTSRSRR